MAEKITKDITLEEVMKIEGAEAILIEQGVPCVTCPMAQMEMKFLKIGEICKNYGIDADKLLEELNKKTK